MSTFQNVYLDAHSVYNHLYTQSVSPTVSELLHIPRVGNDRAYSYVLLEETLLSASELKDTTRISVLFTSKEEILP